jgi:alkylhydroperoxidase family enzyme
VLLEDEALVEQVLADFESSQLTAAEKALFRFLVRVNEESHGIVAEDLERLRGEGWTDDQIYSAVTVCALFNFYNRWIDATGVPALSDEAHREGAQRSAKSGYVRK